MNPEDAQPLPKQKTPRPHPGIGTWEKAMLGLIALMAVLLLARSGDPLRRWGDPFSEANALIAGKHFATEGFFALRFQPVIDPGPLRSPPQYYTHYPPLPDLLCGVMTRLGAKSLAVYRLLPILSSLAMLWLTFLLLRLLIRPEAAFWSVCLMALSATFSVWADCLHQHGYYQMLLAAFLYLLFAPIYAGRPRRPGLLALVLLLQSWCSFEYYLFCLLMLGAAALRPGKGWSRRQLALPAAMLVLGFTLHLLKNAWALGGLSAAVRDLLQSASERSSQSLETGGNPWYALERYLGSFWNEYRCVFLVMGLLALLLPPKQWRGTLRGIPALWWAVGLASVTWWFAMRTHTLTHHFTNRHVLLFLYGSCGLLLNAILSSDRARVGRMVVALGLILMVGYTLPIYRDRAPALPVASLEAARHRLPPDRQVWSNTLLFPVARYYLDRKVYRVRTAPYLPENGGVGATDLPSWWVKNVTPPAAGKVVYVRLRFEGIEPLVEKRLQQPGRQILYADRDIEAIALPPALPREDHP